jgi:uncharacterized protein (TIGR03083 family)
VSDDGAFIAAAYAHWERATEYLVQLAASVDPARWEEPSANAGWTNKELLAHLATGYMTRFARYRAVIDGIDPVKPDELTANEENICKWRDATPEAIVAELRRVRGDFAVLITRLDPRHLSMTTPLTETPRLVRDDLPQIDRHDLDHAADLLPAAVGPPAMPD